MPENNPLNSYQVLECIHRSRRYSHYRATKIDSGREVLIKTPDLARGKDSGLIASLSSEAKACKALNHSSIRTCYDIFDDCTSAFMISQYVKGSILARFSGEGAPLLSQDTVLCWITEILQGLVHAHELGIYHLNLNPYNILVDSENHIKLIGFGKSKTSWLNGEDGFMTYHPILFVAPEIFQAGLVSPSSDLYSVAVLAYLLLCGVPPWRIDLKLSSEQQKQQSLCRAVMMPEILKKEMPDWLFSILLSCLKLDPKLRISSALEMLKAIQSEGSSLLEAEPEPLIEPPASDDVPEPEPITEPEPVIEIAEHEEPDEPVALIIAEMDAEDVPTIPEQAGTLVIPGFEDLPEDEITIPEQAGTPVPPIAQPSTPPTFEPSNPPPLQPSTPPTFEPSNPPSSQRTPLYHSEPYQKQEQPPPQDTKMLKKTFKILLLLSFAVVIFVVVKYVVLGSRPSFTGMEPDTATEQTTLAPSVENQPIAMVLIPADTLVMGNIAPEADDDEFPLLTIKLTPFYISTHEITQAEWLMIYPDNPSNNKYPEFPVENVSFYDIIEYCNAKSIRDGYRPCYDFYDTEVTCNFAADGYRLPTEAEWEFAAKGGQRYDFSDFSGSNQPDDAGWHNGNSNAQSHPGGQKAPNKYGLYDLSGNLFEWVWNWYAPYSFRVPDLSQGPLKGVDRVIRGGSWYHPVSEMRVTNRNHVKPFTKANYIGFRLVRSASE